MSLQKPGAASPVIHILITNVVIMFPDRLWQNDGQLRDTTENKLIICCKATQALL